MILASLLDGGRLPAFIKEGMHMRAIFAVFLACLVLSGCASNRVDYNRQSMSLALGMSKADVQAVLGVPRRTDVNESRERWIFWNPVRYGLTPIDNESLAQDRLVVTFENGKVARWGNQTLADDMAEASRKTMESSFRLMQPQPAK